MNFNIVTLGCKVNQYESEAMREMLLNNGFAESEDSDKADITIINSCTVTAASDAKNRKMIRKIRRNNPEGIIILSGCMPQAFPDIMPDFTQCDIILGNKSRKSLITSINEFLTTHNQVINIEKHDNKNPEYEEITVNDFSGHTRAFVKIQDGCNRFCSYCIIPYSRGRVRSKSLETIKKEVEVLSEKGYKEIVLVGINLSAYGANTEYNLADAVDIVCSVDKIKNVRLGSFEPEMMYDELVKRFSAQPKFCPQFHLSLQSGSNATLKRMHRQYTKEEYMDIVKTLRKYFVNPSITTDVMVGFAGETDEEFNESLNFVKAVGFAKVHIFPYSKREGTLAYKMDNHIDNSIKEKRCKILLEETEKSRREFLESQVGTIGKVLVERYRQDGYYEGYTKNYTPVHIVSQSDITGEIVDVKITECFDDYCAGELV